MEKKIGNREECWRERIAAQERSGVSVKQFCGQQQITEQSFYYWRNKILKSGCKAEESKLRTAERLVNLISSFCILAWRIFWMTMINRSSPEAPPTTALTDIEIQLLE